MITAKELREKYFAFFKEKGHAIIPSASLIPENDPTVLFTTAGMHPLVPYLMGEKHPEGTRLADVQKCVRTGDIDEVGDTTHLTFFEMLGNWSLGDYFKDDSIAWSWEFLTDKKWLGIAPEKLYVTVYEGDDEVPKDEESIKLWQEPFASAGIDAKEGERIFSLGREDNWWGPAGQTGPCGPDTEIFYDTGKDACGGECKPGCGCGKYVEIWNNVFMQYNKKADGSYEPLAQKNVDTGMGVERTVAVLNGAESVFETDVFIPLIKELEKLSEKKYHESEKIQRSMRIVVDHIKAAVFIIADGVTPFKTGSGYVLRRLIRRALYYADSLGVGNKNLWPLIERVALTYQDTYPQLEEKKESIANIIMDEETTFVGHLMFGRKRLEKIIKEEKYISADDAFLLYSTYGFPFELITDIAQENNVEIDQEDFEKKRAAHQELSRTASAGKFKGGLADHGETAVKYHTATHLLHAALHEVLGDHATQKGSNITAERLRFDFVHPQKMTPEEIAQVQDFVNDAIKADLPVACEEMTVKEAKDKGAMGLFEGKYGDKVKVYSIGDVSREICGGPHVARTGALGTFKITKEESASAGVRRIKAVLE